MQVSPLQQAEYHLAVARGLAAVYTLYTQVSGVSTNSFQKDLVRRPSLYDSMICYTPRTAQQLAPKRTSCPLQERLQLYKKKVATVAYDVELAAAKPTLQLDVATANRFINAAMTDLQPGQREALRQVL